MAFDFLREKNRNRHLAAIINRNRPSQQTTIELTLLTKDSKAKASYSGLTSADMKVGNRFGRPSVRATGAVRNDSFI